MKRLSKILPAYGVLPLVITVVLNMVVFYGTRPITASWYHYDFSIALDDKLPFVPFFMLLYILAYITWAIGLVVICREERQICYEVMAGEQIAKLISLVFFLVFPTVMTRPEVTGSGFFNWLVRFIYAADSPNNLFPSLHCLINWLIFRGSMRCKKVGNGYRIFMFISAIIVFVSVLLTKQHLIVDVFGGIAVVEIGLYLSKKLKAYNVYYWIESKMVKHEES